MGVTLKFLIDYISWMTTKTREIQIPVRTQTPPHVASALVPSDLIIKQVNPAHFSTIQG